MDKDLIYKELLNKLSKEQIKINEPMKKHISFKVGGNADFFVIAKSIYDIQNILKIVKKYDIPLNIIGNGTNILVSDDGIEGIVLKVELENIQMENQDVDGQTKAVITAESGVKLAILSQILFKKGISGFEFASGIPGTVGGAILMNAGAHGREMKDCVKQVTYIDIDTNEIKTISNENCKFTYRNSYFSSMNCIILSTVLIFDYGQSTEIKKKMEEYLKYRKEKQPLEYPSAGSTFKRGNDYITAKLIDDCGLKGYRIGGAEVSSKHSGFIINKNNATAEDILKLIEYVKEIIFKKTGKKIELEVKLIGKFKKCK